ncbi:MAG TPA: hypothetical protein VGQ92_27815 [Actinoplanes sp.]|nr:hypothetical protein [Actinoplanes sp.]
MPGTVQVSAGDELSAAVTASGTVFGWGVNRGVRVGNGVTDPNCNFLGLVMSSTPGAGTPVRRGSAVNLSGGQRPAPPRQCN